MKYNNHPGNLFWSNIFCTNKHHQKLTRWPWEILIKLRWECSKLILVIDGRSQAWNISCELALRWMSLISKRWFRWWLKSWEATGHYLSQCRLRFVLPYGVTWPKFGIISIKCKVPLYDRVYQTNGIYFHDRSVYIRTGEASMLITQEWCLFTRGHSVLVIAFRQTDVLMMGFEWPVSLRLMTSQFKDIVNHTKKQQSAKCIFCDVWVQKFVWKFNGHLWNFHTKFWTMHRKICISWGVKNLTTYDILVS